MLKTLNISQKRLIELLRGSLNCFPTRRSKFFSSSPRRELRGSGRALITNRLVTLYGNALA